MNSNSKPDEPAMLIDVETVAHLVGVSNRHVYRLANSGRMPSPLRLGGAVRWRRKDVDQWINDGCPDLSEGGQE